MISLCLVDEEDKNVAYEATKRPSGNVILKPEKSLRRMNNEKGLTELVFILDKSGSMSGLESDTIGAIMQC